MAAEQDTHQASQETELFAPPADFAAAAHVPSFEAYQELHRRSLEDPEGFWREITDGFTWFKPWTQLQEGEPPFVKWFVDGETNISVNCLDRHVEAGRGDKVAYYWEGEPGDTRVVTYADLLADVQRFANALKAQGLKAGDRVVLYMPMVPELPVAMLACARLGVVHSVVFGGFSADAIRDRVNDAGARMIITADGGWRRGRVIPLKGNVDAALADDACPSVEGVIVLKRCENEIGWVDGRDVWWGDVVEGQSDVCPPAHLPAEHPLYILYTSGTTGKPKGVVHAQAGYMVYTALTSKLIFDLRDDDIYWCTADIGWVTGHSYIVYGILANGISGVMYEGAPNHPAEDRFWEIVEKYRVTVFYTAPTAIRTFVRWGDHHPQGHDLSSLRLLGTVGEPINPDAWLWYHRVIGGGRCPIVDTWWQTETGGVLITPLPGATTLKPGSATLPFPGVEPAVVGEDGEPVPDGQRGLLIIKRAWPSMLRGIYQEGWGQPGHPGEFGDSERLIETYWEKFPGRYLTGDGAVRDTDGYYWVIGRVDDTLSVAGHRIGTAEVESALVSHPSVAESAVVGAPDPITGEFISAFVTLRAEFDGSDELQAELIAHVGQVLGRFACPKQLRFTDALPKTRSGKIMRRLLRDIAAGREVVGDTTTLEDLSVLAALRGDEE